MLTRFTGTRGQRTVIRCIARGESTYINHLFSGWFPPSLVSHPPLFPTLPLSEKLKPHYNRHALSRFRFNRVVM